MLTESGRRNAIKHIEARKPLPKKYRGLLFEDKIELTSVACECPVGCHKIAIKGVDIFGNDTMKEFFQ